MRCASLSTPPNKFHSLSYLCNANFRPRNHMFEVYLENRWPACSDLRRKVSTKTVINGSFRFYRKYLKQFSSPERLPRFRRVWQSDIFRGHQRGHGRPVFSNWFVRSSPLKLPSKRKITSGVAIRFIGKVEFFILWSIFRQEADWWEARGTYPSLY